MSNKYPASGGESLDYRNRPLLTSSVSYNTSGNDFVSSVGQFVRDILGGISESYGSDDIDIDFSSDSDSGNYRVKPSRESSFDEFIHENYTPHSSNIITKKVDFGDYFQKTDLSKGLIQPDTVKKMVEEALENYGAEAWNKHQDNRVPRTPFNQDKYIENAKNWNPKPGSVWHNDNFKDVTPVENIAFIDSVHKQLKADEDVTEDDLKEFDFNIKLLSLFKAEREKNELTNHIIKKLQEKQISNSLNLPDLSNMTNQQIPYSRISRGLNVSRGDGRGMVLPAQIPPMPSSDFQSIKGYINGMIKKGQNYMNSEKTKTRKPLIIRYKNLIKDEANKVNIPPEMIAGILFNETPRPKQIGEKIEAVKQYFGKKLHLKAEITIGIAQISPYSALVEKTIGFDPSKYNDYVEKYNKNNTREIEKSVMNSMFAFNYDQYGNLIVQENLRKRIIDIIADKSTKVNNIYELKDIIRDAYKGKITDLRTLKALSNTFNKPFIKDAQKLDLYIKNEANLIKSDIYSIKYLAKLLNRVRLEKGFPKGEKWTDEEIKAVVHEYNSKQFYMLEDYNESIYNNLDHIREWLND